VVWERLGSLSLGGYLVSCSFLLQFVSVYIPLFSVTASVWQFSEKINNISASSICIFHTLPYISEWFKPMLYIRILMDESAGDVQDIRNL
jgi:hypothetical protein